MINGRGLTRRQKCDALTEREERTRRASGFRLSSAAQTRSGGGLSMERLSSLLSTLKTVHPDTVEHEYNVVRSQSLQIKRELNLTSQVGALKENIKKNRYKDILPYDQTRVVLSQQTADAHSDYINASFIKGASGDCRYIACQGPLSSTLTDFWRMIWQHHIKVIVMACREIEMGKRKCECYWAAALQPVVFGPFTVRCQGETKPNKDVVVRNLTVSYQQETQSVIQYQYTSWPDHDVPSDTAGILDLLDRARSSCGADPSPLLIHCSAGCGRTGVICALDYIHDLLVATIPKGFSILKVVLELRKQRPSAVQTQDQYQFIFSAVIHMLERFLQKSDQLYWKQQEVKKLEKEASTPAAFSINRYRPAERQTARFTPRSSRKSAMNDTYAVVNKPKKAQRIPSDPAHSSMVTSSDGIRMLPPSHEYDNDFPEVSAAPLYSTVKPRVKPPNLKLSTSPVYDIAVPAGQSSKGSDCQLVSAGCVSAGDDDYEDVSSSVRDVSSICSPGGIGFNCRVQKPRGPRDPPVQWCRLER
ncbi:tyrosine-protein phosphatase non-receptor type 18 isoform X2 [Nothobranchius furzeri]|uniref:tyrosine-protein phosphatase non-receptor type 18 isoform X2 n=1 Tax=Nothobranchius furzeri TaxID=105023 RepID=UPI0039047E24